MKDWVYLTRRLVVAVLFTALSFPFFAALAATVTSVTDTPSTLQAGFDADHTFTFVTPTGAALGSTIALSFEADFDTSSIVEDDVDVSDDGVDLTTAADCTGAEQASVAMAGDALTITICPGDGGAIGAGSTVGVEIGTHATASGTGTNQIENPASPGTYYVNLSGTFGDSGSVPLPIDGDDSIGVVAVVGGGGGGGPPGGGGGPSDSSAPVISDVQAVNITESAADITWSTNESATSIVDYGLTASYELGTMTDLALVTNHSVHLSGLSEGTTYHYRVRSTDGFGNQAITGDFTFVTLDPNAPVISNISVSGITETSATVSWTTNEPATSIVEYGFTTSYGSTESSDVLVLSHSVLLTGLASGTQFHFRVRSADASGNVAQSGDGTFSTLPNQPPGNVSNFVVTPGEGENQLSWTNPSDPDFTGVRIVACTDTFPSSSEDAIECENIFEGFATAFLHTGLTPDATIFYGVFSRDQAGQFASGALGQGTPSAPEEEPPPEEPEPPTPEPPVTEPPTTPPTQPPSGGGETCGNSVCGVGESSASCALDCPVVVPPDEEPTQPPVAQCGNAVCEAGESSTSCVADCPATLPPNEVLQNSLEYYVAEGTIQLAAQGGALELLPGRALRVQLLTRDLTQLPERVTLSFAGQTFLMAPTFTGQPEGFRAAALGDDAYAAQVTTPSSPNAYNATVLLEYEDGSQQSTNVAFDVQGQGVVRETLSDSTTRVSVGASVTLLLADGTTRWDGEPFGQFNPVTTGGTGTYSWYVPNGAYVLTAEKTGFIPVRRAVIVNDHIVAESITLASEEPEVIPSEPAIPPDVIGAVSDVLDGIDEIRENPVVEAAAEVSIPVLAATAAISGLTLALSFNLLPFLQYLFTAPILLFGRRKRRGYGVVYNAVSKLPVDLATVRLFRVPEQGGPARFVQSRVTDRGGRYAFLAQPGRYVLIASKSGFEFPSQIMQGKRSDLDYLDVYHGEPIEVTEASATIAANIPLDPSQADTMHAPARVVLKKRLRALQEWVAALGVLVAGIFSFLYPSVLTIGMAILQVVIYFAVRRLATAKKPKSWGIVYDPATGKPLARVVARIFEPQYNKLLETTVTDAQGRYSFVLGPSAYYAVFQKEGYQNVEVRPIDLSSKKDVTEFSVKVALPKKSP